MRALTEHERRVILMLAEELKYPEQRVQLLADLRSCTVEEMTPDSSVLTFHIRGYERPAGHKQSQYRAKDGFPVEGSMKDVDGTDITVYLFADISDRLYELELDKHGTTPVVGPDWGSFRIK